MTALATRARAKYRAAPNPMLTLEEVPMRTATTAVMAQTVATPAARPPSASPAARRRVVCPESRTSQRPVSSSPRSNRVLVSNPHTAPASINVIEVLNTVKPAAVSNRGAGPKRALEAWLDPNVAASRSRSACVG